MHFVFELIIDVRLIIPWTVCQQELFIALQKWLMSYCFFPQKLVLCFPRGDKLLKVSKSWLYIPIDFQVYWITYKENFIIFFMLCQLVDIWHDNSYLFQLKFFNSSQIVLPIIELFTTKILYSYSRFPNRRYFIFFPSKWGIAFSNLTWQLGFQDAS